MSQLDPSRKEQSLKAPAVGCLLGGFVIPMVWVGIGIVTYQAGPLAWTGIPVLAVLLAPLGIFCGFLFNLWQDRKVTLSDDALRAELRSMSMESLLEYKTLCPPESREHAFAVAELARRGNS